MTDLDLFRERVGAWRAGVEREARGDTLSTVEVLADTATVNAVATLDTLADVALDRGRIVASVHAVLLDAGAALLGTPLDSLEELRKAVNTATVAHREGTFPLSAFTAADPPNMGPAAKPDLTAYADALTRADRDAAQLAPLLTAVLAVQWLTHLDQPADCPVCATPGALTPTRLNELRDQLRRTTAVNEAATLGGRAVQTARRELDRLIEAVRDTVPAAGHWTSAHLETAAEQLHRLGVDDALAAQAQATAAAIVTAAERTDRAARTVTDVVDRIERAMAGRYELPSELDRSYATSPMPCSS